MNIITRTPYAANSKVDINELGLCKRIDKKIDRAAEVGKNETIIEFQEGEENQIPNIIHDLESLGYDYEIEDDHKILIQW